MKAGGLSALIVLALTGCPPQGGTRDGSSEVSSSDRHLDRKQEVGQEVGCVAPPDLGTMDQGEVDVGRFDGTFDRPVTDRSAADPSRDEREIPGDRPSGEVDSAGDRTFSEGIADGTQTERGAERVVADRPITDQVSADWAGSRCPPCMVLMDEAVCVDIYEASRSDATGTAQGSATDRANCKAGVIPWYRSGLPREEAEQACAAAGKRLCRADEWQQVCAGTEQRVYAYGDEYDPVICNGIDRFCRCGEGSVCAEVDPCPYPHCFNQAPVDGGAGGCGALHRVMPTGSHPDCHNGHGIYDLNGNVWELTVKADDERMFWHGGAYNCIDSETLHRCDYETTSSITAKGFRCCRDPRPGG